MVALMIADLCSADDSPKASRNMRQACETRAMTAYYNRFPEMRIWRDYLLSEGRSVR